MNKICYLLPTLLVVNEVITEIEVVVIAQKLWQVEEFWNEFLDICHVVFSGRQPGVFDTVKHAVSEVKVSSLANQHPRHNNVVTLLPN